VTVNVNGAHALEFVNIAYPTVIAACGDTGSVEQLGALSG
jgi:hypothetical protein